MHISALRWGSSVGTGSLPEAVAVDEVDIFGFKLKIAMMLFFIWSMRESSKLSKFSDLKLVLSIIFNATIATFEN